MSDNQTDLAELYRSTILEHNRNPRGQTDVVDATHRAHLHNALCGDDVTLSLRVVDGEVAAIGFSGDSCAICTASASILCSAAVGRTVAAVLTTGEALQRALGEGTAAPGSWPDVRALEGVRAFPSRIRCATLPWEAAAVALAE